MFVDCIRFISPEFHTQVFFFFFFIDYALRPWNPQYPSTSQFFGYASFEAKDTTDR